MSTSRQVKDSIKAWFKERGWRVERISDEERQYERGGYDASSPIPEGAAAELRSDNPRLRELQQRYQKLDTPLCRHTYWERELGDDVLDLRYFRGDNAYVWQLRNVREHARLKYYLYGQYVRQQDTRSLLGARLAEDGAFGCYTFRYQNMPTLSRDLLDSVNELYFLDRQLGLFERARGLRVLDIGAGFGRLAHRMLAATDSVERYWCIDAVPRSTFLCEWYLRHRGCLDRATVVPLDERDSAIPRGAVDLALNIHSFTEMGEETIAAWLDWLVQLEVRTLLVVPNEPDVIQSYEADHSRRDVMHLFAQRGFRLAAHEPTLRDPDVRELIGVLDQFFLFQRQ